MLGGGGPSQRAPGDTLTCSRSVHSIASGASAPPLLNLSAVSEQRRRAEQRREAQPGPRGRRRPEHLSARAAARSVRSGTSSSAERPPPPGSSSSSSSLLLLSEPRRPLPGRAQPQELSPRASAACEVAGPRPSDRQPGAGAGSFLAPPGRGGRASGGEQPRLGRAQGGSGWARPRVARTLRPAGRGTAARGWSLAPGGPRSAERQWGRHRLGRAEPSGCGGRGPACRPDSRVGVPGRRSVRCARTLPAAAPLPRPPGRSGLAAAAGSPEPPETPAAGRGGPSARVWV
ncbi:translation initiation factor IF-2-like [Alexandromys fortis]|uniref:translation initiation factor IF-2-like n=1 Tax=Alexandromys fortis TaxID=100897 RepID=UPI0021530CEB|nr:translation initiation factor IF-2-like [Microtus fortis]